MQQKKTQKVQKEPPTSKSEDNNLKKKVDKGEKSQNKPPLGRNRDEGLFENKHFLNTIKETRNKGNYTCKLCLDSAFTFKYIRKHLVSKGHKLKAAGDKDFESLLSVIENDRKETPAEQKIETEDYLSFINLCASLSLSIGQISKLGKGLKDFILIKS